MLIDDDYKYLFEEPIADICHYRHRRRLCTFSSLRYFKNRDYEILAYFFANVFWLTWRTKIYK